MQKLPAVVAATLITLLVAAGPTSARTWNVPAEAPTISAAIDSATAGDVIELAAGEYFENDLILKSGLTIRAADPASGATVDGGEAGGIFYALGQDSITLEGLTITGARAYNGAAGRFESCHEVAIRDCEFVANRTTMGIGGALHVSGGSSFLLVDCLFQDNDAPLDDGGAVWLSSPGAEIDRCTFAGNHAINGGGISCSGVDARITACVFTENSASNGAGLDLQGDTAVVVDCLFVGNTATRGGAAACWYGSNPLFVGCTIVENTASDQGGGLYGTGGSAISVERSILAFNANGGAVACVNGSSATLVCSDVYGNVDGDWTGCLAGQEQVDGNFSLDPVFCSRSFETIWGLSADSPCLPGSNPCGLQVGAFGLECGTTGVPTAAGGKPRRLLGNHPNPFNPSTIIAYDLQSPISVDLRIYDLDGHLVDVLLSDEMGSQGRNEIVWNSRDRAGRQLPSGTYFYRLEAGGYVETRRMTLLK